MKSIRDLTVEQLTEVLRIRRLIAALEDRLESLLGGERATRATAAKAQPGRRKGVRGGVTQKQAVVDILSRAERALTINEILAQLHARGVKIRSAAPQRVLRVMLYSDKGKLFARPRPGCFTLKTAPAAKPAKKKA